MELLTIQELTTVAALSGFLIAIGRYLKEYTPLPNRLIPTVLLACGILFSTISTLTLAWPAASFLLILQAIITGMMAAFSATGIYEFSRNAFSKSPPSNQSAEPSNQSAEPSISTGEPPGGSVRSSASSEKIQE